MKEVCRAATSREWVAQRWESNRFFEVAMSSLEKRLAVLVGKSRVTTAKTDRLVYGADAGRGRFLPEVVVYAESAEEVAAVMRLAGELKVPVVPRGAGSGLTGGALAVNGGIMLSLARMNRILEIDTENLLAVVQPGVITAELQTQVEKLGLFYPPDPASKEFSTLGGNVAECAGGPRCVKYGSTRDYVLGLEVVTPAGEIIHTGGRTLKNVVGFDLTRLFVGCEGTLGIVTEITLRLLPKPEAKKTMLLFFSSIDGAAESVSAIIGARIIPATLEFMDRATLACIRGRTEIDIPEECGAALIVEVDGCREWLDGEAARVMEVVADRDVISSIVADTAEDSERIWQMRRAVSPAVREQAPDRFNEDIVVPRSKIPQMIRRLETLSAESGIPIVNFGHAGDGNIHVYILTDLRETGMEARVDALIEQVFTAAVELHGSISGEHGVGLAKARYLDLELSPETIAYMRTLKHALDPDNILNPGKIFLRGPDDE
jgi:glycolate oxidase